MKIGLAVSFFDFRNDVRKIISELSLHSEVVIFCLARDRQMIEKKIPANVANVEVRLIQERRTGLRSRLLEKCFHIFKRLPKSRRNFYLMEHFKISLNKNRWQRLYATFMLELSYRLPGIFSYDRYLDLLQYRAETRLEDIDRMIFFTEIIDDGLLARTLRERRNPVIYVYSWDHPCKHYRFTTRANYLVWSESIKRDLIELQSIPTDAVGILGATQFGYIDMFNNLPPATHRNPYDFEYIYFGCAIGIPALVEAEIAVIKQISEMLEAAASKFKLVVRPYPVLNDWGYYRELQGISRIVLDDSYRNASLAIEDADLMDKFNKVRAAAAFMHMGTTLGYESCFIATPTFIIDYGYCGRGSALSLRNFVHQYQNEKYFLREGSPNVILSDAQLQATLKLLEAGSGDFLKYNSAVSADVALKSFPRLAADLLTLTAADN
jgi:hypothetical protein